MDELEKQVEPQEELQEQVQEQTQEESVEETTENQETNQLNEQENEITENSETIEFEKKSNKGKLIALLCGFNISTLAYFICKYFDPFKNLSDSEIQTYELLTYIKYFMYVSAAISVIGLVVALLKLLKINIGFTKERIEKIIDILEWIIIFPICIAISTFCFSFVFTFTVVDGSSMNPTFKEGEQLLLSYRQNFDRFDVVVVDVSAKVYPQASNNPDYDSLYIKRIIGMPGDRIEYRPRTVEGGDMVTELYINGEKVNEYFYDEEQAKRYLTFQTSHSANTFNMDYVCDIGSEACVDNGEGVLVIPEGYYLILGDNRGNSIDSRVIGLIREEDIIGKITYRVSSLFKYKKVE